MALGKLESRNRKLLTKSSKAILITLFIVVALSIFGTRALNTYNSYIGSPYLKYNTADALHSEAFLSNETGFGAVYVLEDEVMVQQLYEEPDAFVKQSSGEFTVFNQAGGNRGTDSIFVCYNISLGDIYENGNNTFINLSWDCSGWEWSIQNIYAYWYANDLTDWVSPDVSEVVLVEKLDVFHTPTSHAVSISLMENLDLSWPLPWDDYDYRLSDAHSQLGNEAHLRVRYDFNYQGGVDSQINEFTFSANITDVGGEYVISYAHLYEYSTAFSGAGMILASVYIVYHTPRGSSSDYQFSDDNRNPIAFSERRGQDERTRQIIYEEIEKGGFI